MQSEVNGKMNKLFVKPEFRVVLEDKLKLVKILKKHNLREKSNNTDYEHRGPFPGSRGAI